MYLKTLFLSSALFLKGTFAELLGLAFDDPQCPCRAVAHACTEAVAQDITNEPGLPADELQGPLGAGGYALSAPIALILIDLNDLSHPLHAGPLPVHDALHIGPLPENCLDLGQAYALALRAVNG